MNSVTIFLRMPKTGSTTLKSIVMRQTDDENTFIASREIYEKYGNEWSEKEDQERWKYAYTKFSSMEEKKRTSYDYFIGHTWFGVHGDISDGNYQYVTFIRDPVRRFVSLYNYYYDKKGHWLCEEIRSQSLSFADFLMRRDLCKPWENQYTKFVTGDFSPTPETLEKAVENIENHFLFVGLTEHFDADLLRMTELLDWPLPYYTRQNASRNHKSVDNLDPDLLYKVVERNQLDVALYQYVKARRTGTGRLRTRTFQTINWMRNTPVARRLRKLMPAT